MSVVRAFIAINLSPEILDGIRSVTNEMQFRLANIPIRWVPVENIHLTLKFFGDVSITNLDHLKRIMEKVSASHQACEISVGGVGAYPKIQHPRVLWVGLKAPQDLQSLQHNLESETGKLGYAKETRPFSPHLTLGRVSRNATSRDISELAGVLNTSKVGFLGAARVSEMHLYRSDLKSGGPVYSLLFSTSLSGPSLGK